MDSKCRFPGCHWSGDVNAIFEHCKKYHKRYIKEIDEGNTINLTLDDIFNETFLLNGPGGLYWFLLDPTERGQCLRRGMFAIGESEECDYVMKTGSINMGFRNCDIMKKLAQPENSNQFELVWPFDYLVSMNELFQSKKMATYSEEAYTGSHEDGEYSEEVFTGTLEDVDWSEREEQSHNKDLFFCPVCLEYTRSNARFCENRHYLCSGCLDKLIERKITKCPHCGGDYVYGCDDEKIDELLRIIRNPQEN